MFGYTVWPGSNPGRREMSFFIGQSHRPHPAFHDDGCGEAAVGHLHRWRREHVCSKMNLNLFFLII